MGVRLASPAAGANPAAAHNDKRRSSARRTDRYRYDPVYRIRLGYHEDKLRESVKAAGGMWFPERKLWQLSYRLAMAMGLASHIVG